MEIKSLTGLRGLAAWIIVLFHFRDNSPFLSRGDFGDFLGLGYLAVDLFFVLSGFVIFLNYRKSVTSLNRVVLIEFYGRRLARIYPLHLFILLVYLVNPLAISFFSTQGEVGSRYGVLYYLYSLLLIQNWGFTSELAWNVPAWSISVEFAAYLVFPWLILLFVRFEKFGIIFAALGLAFLFALLPFVYWVNGSPSLGSEISSLGLFRCLVQFFIGCIVGYLYLLNRPGLLRCGGGILLVCLVVPAILYWCGIRSDYFLAPIVFFGIIIYLLNPNRIISKALSWRPIYFLGVVSYSTYMVHYFVRDWIGFLSSYLLGWSFATYVLVTFCGSVVLYRFVEVRGRNLFFTFWGKLFKVKKNA